MLAAQCQSPQPQLALKRVVAIQYPWFARMASLQGDVVLTAKISMQGIVTNVHIDSGPQPLALPAKTVLSEWQFTGCTPEQGECEAKFVVSFILNGSCDAENCPMGFEVNFPGKIVVTSTELNKLRY